ncbi:MAG: hypothetical protein JNK45_00610 [Myxococcales bacterium]|nr:hypothetical protein [Myxococcales bacterium]
MIDGRKPDAPPATWAALRDASATVQMAVQMLAGPLAPWSDPPPDPERVREVMAMLVTATRQLGGLITALRGDAEARPLGATTAPSVPATSAPSVPATTAPSAATTTGAPARSPRGTKSPRAEKAARGGEEIVFAPPPVFSVAALLREVEIAVLTATGHHVAMHASAGLEAPGEGAALLPVLVAMVMDAAAMGPADPVVEVRAFADLGDVLGDEIEVVFEVRPDPRVPHGGAFRPNSAGLPAGARLELHRAGGRPRASLRVAAPPGARILAA